MTRDAHPLSTYRAKDSIGTTYRRLAQTRPVSPSRCVISFVNKRDMDGHVAAVVPGPRKGIFNDQPRLHQFCQTKLYSMKLTPARARWIFQAGKYNGMHQVFEDVVLRAPRDLNAYCNALKLPTVLAPCALCMGAESIRGSVGSTLKESQLN
jgi:hypothetical protein